MARNAFNIEKLDENEAERRLALKQPVLRNFATKENKRAALGELGNKVNPSRISTLKEPVLKDKITGFKHVKPRVDCHWKLSKIEAELPKQGVSIKSNEPTKAKYVIKNTENNTKTVVIKHAIVETKKTKDTVKYNNKISIKSNESKPCESIKQTSNVIIQNFTSHSQRLLNDIADIDLNDENNPQMVSEYINNIYDYLYETEILLAIKPNFLQNHYEITPRMRGVLIDWINEVHYQFRLVPETYYMAVGLIDRYLHLVPTIKRKQLQLVGSTALFLASKYEDMFPPSISDFVYITDNTYTDKQIREMEKSIMRSLDYRLGRPLPIQFLRRYSKAGNADGIHHLMAKYFMELASIEYTMAHIKPSEIAAASLLLAFMLQSKTTFFNSGIWTATLVHYSTYDEDHLKPITQQIATLVKNASTVKLRAVYNKYSSSDDFDEISVSSEMDNRLLDEIIRN